MTMTHPVATALVAVPSGLIAEQRAAYDAAGGALLGLSRYARQRIADWVAATLKC